MSVRCILDGQLPTANEIGAIKNTGDVINGALYIKNTSEFDGIRKYRIIDEKNYHADFGITGNGEMALQLYNETDKPNVFDARLNITSSGLLFFIGDTDGSITGHNILHSGNFNDYALPINGNKAMTGSLVIGTSQPYLSLTDNTIERTLQCVMFNNHEASLNNIKDAANYVAIRISPETSDINNLIYLLDVVNGTATKYTILHTGNTNRTSLVATETTPTANNEICWMYE